MVKGKIVTRKGKLPQEQSIRQTGKDVQEHKSRATFRGRIAASGGRLDWEASSPQKGNDPAS